MAALVVVACITSGANHLSNQIWNWLMLEERYLLLMGQHELLIEVVGHVATAYQLPSHEPKEVSDAWVHQPIFALQELVDI